MAELPLEMRHLPDTPQQRRAVESVIMAATDYHLLVEGAPPSADHTAEFFTSLPPGYSLHDLFRLGFYAKEELVGIAGVLRGWNAANKAIIGLLVFTPLHRGKGYGRAALTQIEALARTWPGIDRLRIAVVASNLDAFRFWHKMGFAETGEIKPRFANYVADVVLLEKSVDCFNA